MITRRLAPIVLFALAVFASCSTPTTPDAQSVRMHFAYKFGHPEIDSLFPVFPNPFSRVAGDSVITIRFTIRDSTRDPHVLIQNVIGDEVASYTDSVLAPGTYSGTWNPIGADGTQLRPGLYFITLRSTNYINSRLVNLVDNG